MYVQAQLHNLRVEHSMRIAGATGRELAKSASEAQADKDSYPGWPD